MSVLHINRLHRRTSLQYLARFRQSAIDGPAIDSFGTLQHILNELLARGIQLSVYSLPLARACRTVVSERAMYSFGPRTLIA
jgi:hypothetical protein